MYKEEEIKFTQKDKDIKAMGGGNGTRGTDTNESTTETKGDKKRTRGVSTNPHVKDYYQAEKIKNNK